MEKKLYIYGPGELGKIVYYHFTQSDMPNTSGFVVDDEYYKDATFCDLPVLKESEFLKLDKKNIVIFIALGRER